MRAESLDDDIAESSVRVNSRLVRFLAGVRQFLAIKMGFYLAGKLLASERL
jgi:hypothetical protein